jgi:hypothetical protein
VKLPVLPFVAALLLSAAAATAQETLPAGRAAVLEQAQAEKARTLRPFEPGSAERVLDGLENLFVSGRVHFHPFFDSAYSGGGFTLGAGYARHVSAYNTIDLRGSLTFSGYKRLEAEFLAPRVFKRQGTLTLLGGWREATQVGFFGIGTENTSAADRANYAFTQPYGAAALELRPGRTPLRLYGGLELSRWNQRAGSGSEPSVGDVYTPETLPGLGSSVTYVHSHAGAGIDSRPSPGYARRGGAYSIIVHDFRDDNRGAGFRRTDYDGVHNVPLGRDMWVLSLHARVELANAASDQVIPFYMLPALGGGSSLRGFASWRFRDRNSLLMQADWRVLASRFLDMALFYDAGRVSDSRSDLLSGLLKSDYGVGFRLHSALATPLRVDFARSNEGLSLVCSSKAVF